MIQHMVECDWAVMVGIFHGAIIVGSAMQDLVAAIDEGKYRSH